jgi:branched-chain amino acid transport system ATP-binding protein
MMNETVLKVEEVSLNFGGVKALNDVNFEVKKGELFAIIGPNGAGKTSLLNCISGFYRPQKGSIIFDGKDLAKVASYRIAEMGIARTFQNLALYTGLTTIENLLAGRHIFFKTNPVEASIFYGRTLREEVDHRKVCEEIIDCLEMEHIRNEPVGMLPYGLRKLVELGRALALEPKILLLDEPMAGMNLEEKKDMVRFILALMSLRHFTTILVEHDMEVVMQIAERIVVLDFGQLIAEGYPDEIKRNPRVISAYLGEEQSAASK